MGRKLTDVLTRLASLEAERRIVYIVDFENIPKIDIAALLAPQQVRMVVLAANRGNTVTAEALATIEANPERVEVIIGRVTRKEFVDKLVSAKIGEYAFRFPNDEIVVLANDRDYKDLAQHLNDHWDRDVAIRHEAPSKAAAAAKRMAKKPEKAGKKADKTAQKNEKSAPKTKKAAQKNEKTAKETQKTAKKNEKTAPKAKKVAQKPGKTAEKPEDTAPQPITNPDAETILQLLLKQPAERRPRSETSLFNAVRNYREAMGLRSRPKTIIKHLADRGLVDLTSSPVGYRGG